MNEIFKFESVWSIPFSVKIGQKLPTLDSCEVAYPHFSCHPACNSQNFFKAENVYHESCRAE
jgi:hypothetical protein